jgi:hypothetical protein
LHDYHGFNEHTSTYANLCKYGDFQTGGVGVGGSNPLVPTNFHKF